MRRWESRNWQGTENCGGLKKASSCALPPLTIPGDHQFSIYQLKPCTIRYDLPFSGGLGWRQPFFGGRVPSRAVRNSSLGYWQLSPGSCQTFDKISIPMKCEPPSCRSNYLRSGKRHHTTSWIITIGQDESKIGYRRQYESQSFIITKTVSKLTASEVNMK